MGWLVASRTPESGQAPAESKDVLESINKNKVSRVDRSTYKKHQVKTKSYENEVNNVSK